MRLTLRLLTVVLFMPSLCSAFCFNEAGRRFNLNPNLLQGIAKVESGLNPGAVNKNKNKSTDLGLMQINSAWIADIGLDSKRLLTDPCYNVMTGAKILRSCIDKYGYSWNAVGCYNAASKSKRVAYSWKVHNLLKKEGTKQSPANGKSNSEAQNAAATQNAARSNQSLTFRVKDNAALE